MRQPVLIVDSEGYVPPEEYVVNMEDAIQAWRETKVCALAPPASGQAQPDLIVRRLLN